MIRRLKPLLRHLRRSHTLSRRPPKTPKPPPPKPPNPKPIPAADVYTISGVPVEFPHKPYDTQLAFMTEVVSTLDQARRTGRSHAILESPTGTGKSLSLLCAALAWQRRFGEEAAADAEKKGKRKNAAPKIYFLSRTHSQLTQAIAEYQKTSYRVPMAVLASKKQYCVNRKVCKKGNVDEECKLLLKGESSFCPEFKNAKKVRVHPSIWNEVHNVKDLVEVGRTVRGCPFFAARLMADEAQLVFCPYDYIINTNIRRAMDIDIKGAIIILDEAHNIEEVAREAGSLDVEEEVLCNLQMELDQLRKSERVATIYQPLYGMIKGILSWMADRARDLHDRDLETLNWTGDETMKELQQAGITQCFPQLQECASKAIKAASVAKSNTVLSGISATTLEEVVSSLGYLFTQNGSPAVDYQLVLKRDHSNTSSGWTNSLGLWCLNPATVFKEIADLCLSVILTSGTLSPMSSFASELGVQFEARLEAPHVIDVHSQLWAAVISSGPRNCKLNASFETAYGYDFQDALGDSLERICKVVPGGVLVFFPSYKLMDSLLVRWSQTGQRSRLNAQKSIFIEPKKGLDTVLKGYRDSIPTGAVLLAVCRGKVSEGIDFSDENARAVVIVGIPYPDTHNRKILLKRKYNDMYKSSKGLLCGMEWYCQQAFRAVNQAAGRCIRHRFDYGAIILLDERFLERRNVAYTSKWLRNSIKQYDDFDKSIEDLKTFFEDRRRESLRWSPPAEGALKLNISGVVDSRTGNAVAGFIVGNHKREVLMCGGVKVAGNSVLIAEGCALRVGLKVLQDEGYSGQLCVESDNKIVISNLTQAKPENEIIKGCCRMLQRRGDWQASHTCQEANSATVWVAQEAKRIGDFVWTNDFPPQLVELLA